MSSSSKGNESESSTLLAPAAEDYAALLSEIKQRVQAAQIRAALAVNRELVLLYWQIGRQIAARQVQQGWGAKVIEQLARDLKAAFPDMAGFSPRNLRYMRDFAEAYPDEQILQQVVAKLPWGHNVRLLDKVPNPETRLWYAHAAIEHGWSRAVLEHQIDTRLIKRQGKAITNFARTLPAPQSDLAQQMLKDPYNFDFLTLGEDARERHLEAGLRQHIREFLLEMGAGFAFVGTQYPLTIGEQEFFIDLLFYHLDLRCFVVIDLKMRAFEPEFAGKMNFYLSAVDDLLRRAGDAPSIGIILCKTRNATVAEYALRGTNRPIGVAEHLTTELTRSLPADLQSALPTIEDLEAEAAEVPFPDGEDAEEAREQG
jgi:predicted nuclease of restriction endonuclease-like (RecB) superfamily